MAPLAIFRNRASAGRQLASRLAREPFTDPVVLALPRGGVPVGYEVAKALNAPLDLLLVRKIGVPGQSELAAGAVVDGQNPDLVLNDHVIGVAGLDASTIRMLAALELEEVERRRRTYLSGRAPVPIIGRSAIVVDDGIATGASIRAALTALRRRQPKDLTLAVPVAPAETVAELRPLVDRIGRYR